MINVRQDRNGGAYFDPVLQAFPPGDWQTGVSYHENGEAGAAN